MGQPPKIDWSLPRNEYVMGSDLVTVTGLAEKYGVSREVLSRHKAKEDWDSQRSQYRHQVVTKTRERASTYEAARLAKVLRVAEAMRSISLDQLNKLRREEADGTSKLEKTMGVGEVRQWLVGASMLEKEAIGSEQEVEIRLRGELVEALAALRAGLTDDEYKKVVGILAAIQPSAG